MSEIPDTHPDWKRIDAALDALSEHFGEVQIFATKYETESEVGSDECGTISLAAGRGNIYARMGFVREWLIRQDERSRLKESE